MRAPSVGIKMGSELCRELRNCGHITDEQFGVSGTSILKQPLSAYKKKFAVCVDPNVAEEIRRPGRDLRVDVLDLFLTVHESASPQQPLLFAWCAIGQRDRPISAPIGRAGSRLGPVARCRTSRMR